MREVFAEHRPTSSSTPPPTSTSALMEANPVEAVRNNAIATRVMARVAGELGRAALRARLDRQGGRARDRHGRVQGAGRVGARGRRRALPGHALRAVRFGNVLGSSGSVVPIFRRQIARGGPVTVTDPRDDALLHDDPGGGPARSSSAGSLARGGEVFVLEMGEPVRIIDLARAMIQLSGPGARPRHRDRGRRRRARARSSTRSSSTPTSARCRPRRRGSCAPSARRSSRSGSRRCSTRSGCSCSRATPPRWPRRSPSWRRARPPAPPGVAPTAATADPLRAEAAWRPDAPRLAGFDDGPAFALSLRTCREVGAYVGHRRVLRPRRPLAAVLRPGARAQAPARVGGPRARARAGARAARRSRRPRRRAACRSAAHRAGPAAGAAAATGAGAAGAQAAAGAPAAARASRPAARPAAAATDEHTPEEAEPDKVKPTRSSRTSRRPPSRPPSSSPWSPRRPPRRRRRPPRATARASPPRPRR